MSARLAPSRRSSVTSSTRCRTVAWSDFMRGHHVGKPCVVETVQPGVTGQGELLLISGRSQVRAALDDVAPAVGQGQRDDLAMRPCGRDALTPLGGQFLE